MNNKDPEFKEILDNLYDGVYFVDRERRITYWNKGAERITGYSARQLVGHRCMDNILNHVTENGAQLCLNGCPLFATIEDGKQRQAEIYLHHANGHRIPVMVRTSPIRDKNGKINGAVETFSDNTSLLTIRRKMGKLEKTILLDPGTGIGNRRYIEAKLRSAMDEFQQQRIPVGVLFLDLDYFKLVNDTYGHDTGDKVLEMVAKTLQRNMRSGDTIARWGGEEFIAILSGINKQGLFSAARKLCHLVEESYINIENTEIHVTVSIGASMLRLEDNLESLIKRVDQNLYKSKLSGRNRISGDIKGAK
jgi:diguanylate cyclase (GGDEF)-like protein/PAS domain S-box-containing protein